MIKDNRQLKTSSNTLVTVVIATYNNAETIRSAINSVLNQTLSSLDVVVVDDCSNDRTRQIVKDISKSSPQVFLITLTKNSGAAGKPRNIGIKHAKGKYIFFLDGDDILDRHALKNLITVLLQMVATSNGGTLRYDCNTKKETNWLPYLFKEEKHNTTLNDMPELVDDVLITNKLYKKDFLRNSNLIFESGVHFEDIIFSAQAFTNAKSISIIPDDIYIWYIYNLNTRKSITHQRDSLRNLDDRVSALKKREKTYKSINNSRVSLQVDQHFLKSNVIFCLLDAIEYTDSHTDNVIAIFKPMVKKIPKSVFRHLEIHHRVAIAMLLLEDKVGLKELAYYRRHGKLAGKFIKQGNRVYWVSSRSNTPSNDAWIKELQDVTSTKIFDTPSDQCVYFHQLESINKSNHRMELKGITKDPLKKFDFSKKVDAQLILQYNKKEQTNHNILASISVSPSNEIVWSVIVDSSSIPARFSHGRYHIILELNKDIVQIKAKFL